MKHTFYTLLLALLPAFTSAQVLDIQLVTSGFDSPIDLAWAPGRNHMYVVQQRGKIFIVDSAGNQLPGHFMDISHMVSSSGDERGLLGLVFHPDYVQNGYFYVNYTRQGDGKTMISRFSRSGSDPLKGDSLSEINLMNIYQPYSNHNAGDLAFGPDGYLYIGTGDGGSSGDPENRSQNPDSILGKMLRIDVDNGLPYLVPSDNPFVGNPDTLPEIWALGLRNPWRFSFDRSTGDMWIADVGQNVYEEINMEPANSGGGFNYGWRCYEANTAFNTNGCGQQSDYTSPVAVYGHNPDCSVTGGYVYRGSQHPILDGKYLYADYCSGIIRQTYHNGSQWQTDHLDTLNGQFITTFGEDHDGELYLASRGGSIYKIGTSVLSTEDANQAASGIALFPSPAHDVINITLTQSLASPGNLRIMDIHGRTVMQQVWNFAANESGQVNVATLPAGTYFLAITGENYEKSIRFVKW